MLGVAFDDVATQKRFHEKEGLNFDLLSDPDGSVAKKFGVGMGARPYARRWSFYVDPSGIVRHIDKKVRVRSHGEDVAAKVAELRGG